MNYYAHTSKDAAGRSLGKETWQLLRDHLRGVADRAGAFARPFGMEAETRTAGLLHDLGKYAARFQARLCDPAAIHGVNHWAAGAACALERKLWSVAFAVDGHHTGLPSRNTSTVADARTLREIHEKMGDPAAWKKLTGECVEPLAELRARLEVDKLVLPEIAARPVADKFAEALRTRFLFSCLIDADRLDTAGHTDPGQEKERRVPALEPERALAVLQRTLGGKSILTAVNQLRSRLLADCLHAAEQSPGLFTLTAPTGSGKTLASLAFALRHIEHHNAALAADDPRRLRRIIVVIPFTSVIEQTASVFRGVFEQEFGADYVLEHHSAVAPRATDPGPDKDAEDARLRRAQLVTENWDAPIVVTTNVQFFESLFAARPSDCRKLHNIARSVLLFDEVQTLPTGLLPSLLSAVDLLTRPEPYGATAVFMTATQPAFDRVAPKILPTGYEWRPREISSDPEAMAHTMRRTRIVLPAPEEMVTWADLAGQLAAHAQALCVVNTVKDARALFRLLPEANRFHLSARMCPVHRLKTLDLIRARLKAGEPVRLVSTPLIEAGVDVDFPVAYRAYGPFDSIIQTAGRCNREGTNPERCPVTVFRPSEGSLMPKGTEKVGKVTESFLVGQDPETLHQPETYARYFEQLYAFSGPETAEADEVIKRTREWDFPAVAEAFRLIPEGTRRVVVKWPGGRGEELAAKLEKQRHLSRQECRELQRFSISLYEGEFQKERANGVIYQPAEKWEFYVWNGNYDEHLGMCHVDVSSEAF